MTPEHPKKLPPRAAQRQSSADLFEASFTISEFNGQPLPAVVHALLPEVNLESWAATKREWIANTLHRCGAILFRGFSSISELGLPQTTDVLIGPKLPYMYRSTPRTELNKGIYTATEYPADQRIPLHNENSYQSVWPLRLVFYCAQAAESGGETPLADMRGVLLRLRPKLVAKFAERGVMYVRNYHRQAGHGPDLPWTVVFQTDAPSEVEEYCKTKGISFSWLGDGRLRTWQKRPAVMAHPKTGERVWFNQAHLFHWSNLPEFVQTSLLDLYSEDELPRNARFGDGSALSAEDLTEIREAIDAETVSFPWRTDDLLLVDNMLVAHGRMPFSGPRRILVAMGESYDPSVAGA